MDLYILDENLETVAVIDDAESVIWSDRYYEAGDFEIYIRPTETAMATLRIGRFVQRAESDMVGIIQKVEIKTDAEAGPYLTATGPDLKSIVGRRVIWPQEDLTDTVENVIRKLVTDSIIAPTDKNRRIPNFVLGAAIGGMESITVQYAGDNLADTIIALLKSYNLGWKVLLNASKQFELVLYRGTDRSMGQSANPYVTFSPDFDNLQSTAYTLDIAPLKTSAIVAGEGEGTNRVSVVVGVGDAQAGSAIVGTSKVYGAPGIDLTELFVDAQSLSCTKEGGLATEEEYEALLAEHGRQQLADNGMGKTLEGAIDTNGTYRYGVDYGIGDVVNIQNEFGVTGYARILEIMESESGENHRFEPKFDTIEVV